MNTLGIVMARSGSKGIVDKNIKNLFGKPLMAYTIENALQCRYIDKVMVSTDSMDYARIARDFGAEVPFLRSDKNATDTAKSIDVLLEVLDLYEGRGQCFENVVALQPTSPFRTYKHLDEAFQLFYDKLADSVVSVCECEHNPLWANTLPLDLNMYGFIKSNTNVRRQDLQQYYRLNGAIYISKVSRLKQTQSFYGEASYAFIMDQRSSVDIDTELDFAFAEFLMTRGNESERS